MFIKNRLISSSLGWSEPFFLLNSSYPPHQSHFLLSSSLFLFLPLIYFKYILFALSAFAHKSKLRKNLNIMVCYSIPLKALWHPSHMALFFLGRSLNVGFLFFCLCFPPWYFTKWGPKVILFESYQGEWGASYSFISFSAFAIYTFYRN